MKSKNMKKVNQMEKENTVQKAIEILKENNLETREITNEDILHASERIEINPKYKDEIRFMDAEELYELILEDLLREGHDI